MPSPIFSAGFLRWQQRCSVLGPAVFLCVLETQRSKSCLNNDLENLHPSNIAQAGALLYKHVTSMEKALLLLNESCCAWKYERCPWKLTFRVTVQMEWGWKWISAFEWLYAVSLIDLPVLILQIGGLCVMHSCRPCLEWSRNIIYGDILISAFEELASINSVGNCMCRVSESHQVFFRNAGCSMRFILWLSEG